MISLIAAIGKNNELGKNNTLLWSMPADMKHFQETTRGHTVIMGRKTFESLGHSSTGELGRSLPNRRNIVITRDENYSRRDIEVVHSLEEALNLAKSEKNEEIFIIGGAEIYRQTILLADKLYLTHIGAEDNTADSFFPKIDKSKWREVSRKEHKKDKDNPCDYTFSIYERI